MSEEGKSDDIKIFKTIDEAEKYHNKNINDPNRIKSEKILIKMLDNSQVIEDLFKNFNTCDCLQDLNESKTAKYYKIKDYFDEINRRSNSDDETFTLKNFQILNQLYKSAIANKSAREYREQSAIMSDESSQGEYTPVKPSRKRSGDDELKTSAVGFNLRNVESVSSIDAELTKMAQIKKIVDAENDYIFTKGNGSFDHVARFFDGRNPVAAFNVNMHNYVDDSDDVRIAFMCLDGIDFFSEHFKKMGGLDIYKEAFEQMTYKLLLKDGKETTIYGSKKKISISNLHKNAGLIFCHFFGGGVKSVAYTNIFNKEIIESIGKELNQCAHYNAFKEQMRMVVSAQIQNFETLKITRMILPFSEVQEIQNHIRILTNAMLGIITFIEIKFATNFTNSLFASLVGPAILAMKKLVYCLMLPIFVKESLDSLVLNDNNAESKIARFGETYDQIAACESNVPVLTRQKLQVNEGNTDMTFIYINHSTGGLIISLLFSDVINNVIFGNYEFAEVSNKMSTIVGELNQLHEFGKSNGSYLNVISNNELVTEMDGIVTRLKTLLEETDANTGKTMWEYLTDASEQVSQSSMKQYRAIGETSLLLLLRLAERVYQGNGGGDPVNSQRLNRDSSFHDLKDLSHYRSMAVAHSGFAFVTNDMCDILKIDALLYLDDASLICAINAKLNELRSAELILRIHDICIKKIKQDFALLTTVEMPTLEQMIIEFDKLANNASTDIMKFVNATDVEICKYAKQYWPQQRDVDNKIESFMSSNVWSILNYTNIDKICLVPFQLAKLFSCIRYIGGADNNQREAFTRAKRDKVFKIQGGEFIIIPCHEPYVTEVEETSNASNARHVHLLDGKDALISILFNQVRLAGPVNFGVDLSTKRNPDIVCSNVGFPSLADAAGNPESKYSLACESLIKQFIISPRLRFSGLTLPKSIEFAKQIVKKREYFSVELLSVNMVGFLDQSDFPKITLANHSDKFISLRNAFVEVLKENARDVDELKDEMDSTELKLNELKTELMQQNQTSDSMIIDQDQKQSVMGELTKSLSTISKEYEDARDFYDPVNEKLEVFITTLLGFKGNDPAKFFSDEIYTLSYEISRIINLQQQQPDQKRFGLYFHTRLINAFCLVFFEKQRFSQIKVDEIDASKRSRKKTVKGGAYNILDSPNLNAFYQITPSDKNEFALTTAQPSDKNKFESIAPVQIEQYSNKMNENVSFDKITDENGDVLFVAEYGFYMDYGKIDPSDEDSEMQLMMFPIKTEEQLAEVQERFKPLQPTHIGGKGRRANRGAIKHKKTKKRASNAPLRRVTKNKNKNKNKHKTNKSEKKNKKNHYNNRKKTRR